MILFNLVLIIHFTAFLLFLAQLIIQFPNEKKQLHKQAMYLGITIVITGILLIVIKYPQVNLYKVIPKSVLFIIISTLCGTYSNKILTKKIYYTIMALTVLASLIAVVKV